MSKSDLTELSIEELQQKSKGHKALIGIFIPLIIGLFYFSLRDYLNGTAEVDMATLTIAICSVGGMAPSISGLKAVKGELTSRGV